MLYQFLAFWVKKTQIQQLSVHLWLCRSELFSAVMCLPVELHSSLCLALPRAFILLQNKSYSVILHQKQILGISRCVPGGFVSGCSQQVARQVLCEGPAVPPPRCTAGVLGVLMSSSPCPCRTVPGRKNARRPPEIRMFLWLNCFVASIECVPGLDLNSCAGPGVCSTGAWAAVGA